MLVKGVDHLPDTPMAHIDSISYFGCAFARCGEKNYGCPVARKRIITISKLVEGYQFVMYKLPCMLSHAGIIS